jgi:hypothetical protein
MTGLVTCLYLCAFSAKTSHFIFVSDILTHANLWVSQFRVVEMEGFCRNLLAIFFSLFYINKNLFTHLLICLDFVSMIGL